MSTPLVCNGRDSAVEYMESRAGLGLRVVFQTSDRGSIPLTRSKRPTGRSAPLPGRSTTRSTTPVGVCSAALVAVALAGCSPPETQAAATEPVAIDRPTIGGYGSDMAIWTDAQTGCEYLVWARVQGGGVTPRLNTAGRPICRYPDRGGQ